MKETLPKKEGKYIVKTKSKYRNNVLDVNFHLDKDGNPVWGCDRQIVTHFLEIHENG